MTFQPRVPEQSPSAEDAEATLQPSPWRKLLERGPVRTILGLLVLGAILGGLVGFNRLGGSDSELGPLDGRSPEVGGPAPQFVLADPQGNARRLSDFQGQVVWVNFWATWCGPCRRELPAMQRLSDEFGDQGLVILAVNFEESADKALDFWDELGIDLPILLDSDGEVAGQYRVRGFPGHFFIDRDGTIMSLEIGDLTEDEMRERLAELGMEP